MIAGIGHNGGPDMVGYSWRKTSWQKARAALLPTLPIEVVRLRVKRAQELGLPYKTYASVRAATGTDVIGFLFSSNALQMLKTAQLPDDRAAKLAALVRTDRTAIVHRPIAPETVADLDGLDAAHAAPLFTRSWSDMSREMREIVLARGGKGDGYVLVGEGAFEREWVAAGKLAGFVTGDTYFAGANT